METKLLNVIREEGKIIKFCKNCGKPFETYPKKRKNSGLRFRILKRPVNSVTCSSKCSRGYNRKRLLVNYGN
jgi:hypothetical protein